MPKVVITTTKARRKPHKGKKRASRGEFTLQKADTLFSLQIRARDKICLFPGCGRTTDLTCSHYFGRTNKSTRWYEDNCITLCRFHHYRSKDLGFEYQRQTIEKHGYDGQYTLFMKKFIGETRWIILLETAKLGGTQKYWLNEYKTLLESL